MILAPHATIEPCRERLLRDFIGESGAADELWRRRLGEGVASSGIELRAVLADRTMTIGDLEDLAPGRTLTFASSGGVSVDLCSGPTPLAKGRVGRLGDIIAVKIDAAVNVAAIKDMEDAA